MNIAKGKFGEDTAVEFLTTQNYRILERNFRIKLGELDIIAIKDEVLYAIEVKYRRVIEEDFHPYLTMTKAKLLKMQSVLQSYLLNNTQFGSFAVSFCLIAVDEKSKVNFYSHLSN